jgi:hypothetical protein
MDLFDRKCLLLLKTRRDCGPSQGLIATFIILVDAVAILVASIVVNEYLPILAVLFEIDQNWNWMKYISLKRKTTWLGMAKLKLKTQSQIHYPQCFHIHTHKDTHIIRLMIKMSHSIFPQLTMR